MCPSAVRQETPTSASSDAAATAVADPRWLAAMFGNSPDLVALLACNGDVLAANRAPEGRHANAPAGYAASEHFHLGSRPDVQYAIARAVESHRAARVEAVGTRADGTRGWHLLTLTPVMRGAQAEALMLVATDITERRREEERLRRSESLMVDTQGVAHLGTWEWDITQPHAVYSLELCRIYGLDPKTHVPSYEDYLTRVHPDDRQRVIDATNKVFHELRPYSHDERVFRADGSLRYLHTWAMPVLDDHGKLAKLVGVCQDITDRKLAELALEQRAEELARSNAELDQFAHVASHDLQEPLRTVAGFVQILAKRYRGQLDAAADEAIDFALQGVYRMKGLITELLAHGQISSQPLQPQDVELSAALEQACADLRTVIADTGASIRAGALPKVRAESAQVSSLLLNLLANAIKFRGEHPPQIEISARRVDGMIEVAVRDNGIGIDPTHQQRIFVVFQRLNADTPGTGIGLAVCKKIVERHGGRIWVESQAGQGATFRFTLPAAAAPVTAMERRP